MGGGRWLVDMGSWVWGWDGMGWDGMRCEWWALRVLFACLLAYLLLSCLELACLIPSRRRGRVARVENKNVESRMDMRCAG